MQHAKHAKELGYVEMARLAQERAERARGGRGSAGQTAPAYGPLLAWQAVTTTATKPLCWSLRTPTGSDERCDDGS
jgi:hypothetical protein